MAGVSSGNVREVKNTLTHACSSLLEAARTEQISINLADKWSREPQVQQQEYLRRMRIERGIRRKARNVVAAHLARVSPPTAFPTQRWMLRLGLRLTFLAEAYRKGALKANFSTEESIRTTRVAMRCV